MYDWIQTIQRKAGHTTAACGKSDRDVLVITGTQRQADDIKTRFGVEAVGLEGAENRLIGQLPGPPVVFDTYAVQMMQAMFASMLLKQREQYEKRIEKMKARARGILGC